MIERREHMNELKVFQNEEFGEVRSLVINDEPWFVGKDVAKALGYENPSKAIRDHVEEEDKKVGVQNVTPYISDNLGRKQYPTFINESGVYSLIFGSKLPSAKKFKHWVTSEVLPTLRKTGKYEIPKDPMSALKLMFEAQTQTNEKVEKHDQRIAELENNALLTPGQYNYLSKAVQRKVAQIKKELGWKLQSKQNSQLYRSINRDLDRYLGVKTRSQLRIKDFDKALQFIENWQLSYADKMIIEQLSLDV
jgi:prophage antirepressor-like protein